MSDFRLKIEGKEGSIAYDAFFNVLNYWFKILNDVDLAMSGSKNGSQEWFVTKLGTGSLVLEAEAEPKQDYPDIGQQIAAASINGLYALEEEGLTPPYLSFSGIGYAKKMLKLIGNHGIQAINLENQSASAVLTSRASANIDLITKVKRRSIGSVEGRLETISVHRTPKFLVYHHRTNKAIACVFNQNDLLEKVKEGLGRRVIAFGEVLWNSNGEPVSVNIERLRFLGAKAELPSISEIGGSDPEFTGKLSTAEFLKEIRGA